MFLGDKGQPSKFNNTRRNYEIIIDNERNTINKMMQHLGFYSIVFQNRMNEIEVVYDTERKLLTGAGLILRKKVTKQRSYFSLVRVSNMDNIQTREKKSFLGECEPKDQAKDFPREIAEGINKIFNNLFTINLEDLVSHCTPYISFEIRGNRYKIISGTGYEAEMSFETLIVRDLRANRKVKKRNFSIEMDNNPAYEHERQQILDVIDKHCKELFFVNRNRFEIAQVAVRVPEKKETEDGKKKKFDKKAIQTQQENA